MAAADDDAALSPLELATAAVTCLLPYALTLVATVSTTDVIRGRSIAGALADVTAARLMRAVPSAFLVYCALVWPVCWLIRGRERLLLLLAAGLTCVPLGVAWLHKLAYYAGRWLATGSADWAHEFRPSLTDSMVRSAHLLGVDDIVVGLDIYRTVGLAPTMQHWRMGMLDTANLGVYVLFIYIVVRVVQRIVAAIRAEAVARRRARRPK